MTWRALAAALMALLCGTASAAEFYQGKQVTIVVGFSSGGTYDATRGCSRGISANICRASPR